MLAGNKKVQDLLRELSLAKATGYPLICQIENKPLDADYLLKC
jgi:hypothetical protein